MGQGYNDWERTGQAADVALLYNTTFNIGADTLSPAMYAGNWSAVSVFIKGNASTAGNLYRAVLTFYADQALSQPVQSFTWDSRDTIPIYDAVAVVAPWCQLAVFHGSISAGHTATVGITPFSSALSNRRSNSPAGVLSIASVTILAGGTLQSYANYATTGEVSIACSLTGTNRVGFANLWSFDYLGNSTIVWGHNFVSGDGQDYVNDTIWIPGVQLQLWVTNRGANSATANAFIGAQA